MLCGEDGSCCGALKIQQRAKVLFWTLAHERNFTNSFRWQIGLPLVRNVVDAMVEWRMRCLW